MSDDLRRLRTKLCRELAQSEHSAEVHCAREANRLGQIPPAVALRVISEHAAELKPSLQALLDDQQIGRSLGQVVGATFSVLRHFLFDRLIDAERSYRGTLLGLHHGIDIVRLLREVAYCSAERDLMRWCDGFLIERTALVEQAEHAMVWFAERPARALRSGVRMALQSGK